MEQESETAWEKVSVGRRRSHRRYRGEAGGCGTDLKIYALDILDEMCELAEKNARCEGLSGRVVPVVADVGCMPFPDNFADLIVSGGSAPFWPDKTTAFKEAYRVLKPNGMTYIGGGMGIEI